MTHEGNVVIDTSRAEPAGVEAPADSTDGLRQKIELRAYYRYCERGCAPGGELDDWLAAEQELLAPEATTGSSPVESSAHDRRHRGRPRDRAGR